MLITKPEQLIVGNTVFVVHKIRNESWITDTQINSKPKISKYTGYIYIDTESYNEIVDSYIPGRLFLNDFNITENTYNNHRIFSDEQEAKNYVNS